MAKAKYKKGKDGRWQTKVWDGTYGPDGIKHYVPVYSTKSSGDLEKTVNKMKADVENRKYVRPTEQDFVEYAKEWLKTYKAGREKATRAMYSNIIDVHFKPLKGIKLADIQKKHFQQIINNAYKMPRTCQQINITFHQVIQNGIQEKFLPADALTEICSNIDIPKYKPKEKRPLTALEKTGIKSADLSPMEKTFVLLIFGTGLRRGEALAQTTTSINLQAKTLSVTQAVGFDGNNPYIKDTKNLRKRTVPLPGYLVKQLQSYLRSIPGPYLFTKQDGTLMTKSSYVKMWARIVDKINLAAGGTDELRVVFNLTAHVFRHNYCTNLCYQIPKISIKKIAALMGDTEKMVIEVYNHIMEEKEDAAAVVENALNLEENFEDEMKIKPLRKGSEDTNKISKTG